MQKFFHRPTARQLVLMAMLTAAEIVLSRFLSISTPHVKIGFGFAAVALCGMLFGPVWAGVCAALADITGAILFPIGPYFPGFTLTAALTGALFGLFLYQKAGSAGLWRCFAAALVSAFVLSLGLNTLWIHILYGTSYPVLLASRLVQCVVMLPVQAVVLVLLDTRVRRLLPLAQRPSA